MSDRPCDTEEPDATVRHLHTSLRQRIDRFNDAKVIDLWRHQMARQQIDNDLCMALARAFRSTEAAGKYDDEGDGNDPR
jgi:hypothetical protein